MLPFDLLAHPHLIAWNEVILNISVPKSISHHHDSDNAQQLETDPLFPQSRIIRIVNDFRSCECARICFMSEK
jgi:hypothetical protein